MHHSGITSPPQRPGLSNNRARSRRGSEILAGDEQTEKHAAFARRGHITSHGVEGHVERTPVIATASRSPITHHSGDGGQALPP